MKIRLSITAGATRPREFEHAGPVIRIGRDADCELSLQGEEGNVVSRQHARIDLSPTGATVTDAGSSNGTLLNGRLLEGVAPLRVGDLVQMGYTGATLQVLDLQVGTLSPAGTPLGHKAVLIGSIAAAALAVAVVAFILLRKPEEPEERAVVPVGTDSRSTNKKRPAPDPPADGGKKTTPPAPKRDRPEPRTDGPNVEIKKIGRYVALKNWVSVLLQRQGRAYPWTVLRPEGRVSTAHTLVSLPGYRSLIALDAGVHLTLWGNLPEFSPFPPVLESVVMLEIPSPGTDLDFTLDRGRVIVANRRKPAGPARVRLRFLSEVWDLQLPDADSEAALELWTLPHGAPEDAKREEPAVCLGLFTKGRVVVNAQGKRFDLGARSRLTWVSQDRVSPNQTSLPELPRWWTKPPDNKAPLVRKALRSLLDWSKLLGGSNTDPGKTKVAVEGQKLVETKIKTQVDEEVKDADNQDVGVFFLGALDETGLLVDLLIGHHPANVRGATLLALQAWLSRGSQHADELAGILEGHSYARDEAERIVRLLHFLPREALGRKRTYEELVDSLDHDRLLVRDLAFWHLDQLGVGGRLPKEAKEIAYDPTWDRDKRRSAIAQWRKLIAEGKVPLRPPK